LHLEHDLVGFRTARESSSTIAATAAVGIEREIMARCLHASACWQEIEVIAGGVATLRAKNSISVFPCE